MYTDYVDPAIEIEKNSGGSDDGICDGKKRVPEIRLAVNDFKHSERKTREAAQAGD
jgi:hypothetical protein